MGRGAFGRTAREDAPAHFKRLSEPSDNLGDLDEYAILEPGLKCPVFEEPLDATSPHRLQSAGERIAPGSLSRPDRNLVISAARVGSAEAEVNNDAANTVRHNERGAWDALGMNKG